MNASSGARSPSGIPPRPSFGQLLYPSCQIEILPGKAPGIVGRQAQAYAVVPDVDVRMVTGLFRNIAETIHEVERSAKVFEFKRLYKHSIFDFPAGQRDQAEQEVKASLLLDKIADEEKIVVTDEEMNHEVEALAAQSKQPVEAIRERLTHDGALDRIRARIRNEKALEFLYQQSA